jgi:DNA repair protein RecO (recombination protein O)
MAEVAEQVLPPAEPNERFFRLLLTVLDHLRTGSQGSAWRAVTYFTLWTVRLGGFLPDLRVSRESRSVAEEMLRNPVGQIGGEWRRETAADLRHFLVRRIEEQIERRLLTVPLLEAL